MIGARTTITAVAVVVALAAPGTASGQEPDNEFVIIGIGDSYSSGEGNPEQPGNFDAQGQNPSPAEEWIVNPDETIPGPGRSGDFGPFPGGSDDGLRDDYHQCHRSPLAWQQLAANALQAANPGIRVTFRSFACSGATIRGNPNDPATGGVLTPYDGADPDLTTPLRPQIQQINEDFLAGREGAAKRIDALVMTAGGNDANFAPLVALCIGDNIENSVRFAGATVTAALVALPGVNVLAPLISAALTEAAASQLRNCNFSVALRGEAPTPNLNPITGWVANAGLENLYGKADVPGRFEQLSQSFENRLTGGPNLAVPPGRVYISELPNPLRDEDGDLCDGNETNDPLYRGLLRGEARFMEEKVLGPLNQAYADGASNADPEWVYVSGAAQASRNHGVCSDGARFFRTNAEGLRQQGNDLRGPELSIFFSGPLSSAIAHPNAAGHVAMAAPFVSVLQQQIEQQFRPRRPTLTVGRVTAPRGIRAPDPPDVPGPRNRAQAAGGAGFCPTDAAGRNPGCVELRWTAPAQAGVPRFQLQIRERGRPGARVLDMPEGATSFVHRAAGVFTYTLQNCPSSGCRAFGAGAILSNSLDVSNLRPGRPTDLRQLNPILGPAARPQESITIRWTPADARQSRFEVDYRPLPDPGDPVVPRPLLAELGPEGTELATLGPFRTRRGGTGARTTTSTFGVGSPFAGVSNPVTEPFEFRVRACSEVSCSAFTPPEVFSPGRPDRRGQGVIDDVQQFLRNAGRPFPIELLWLHPRRASLLDSVDVRIVGRDGVIGCVRLDQDNGRLGATSGTCRSNLRTTITPGRGGRLTRGALTLSGRGSRLLNPGRRGRLFSARANVTLRRSIEGQVLRVEAAARDNTGRGSFRPIGTIIIPGR